MTESEVKQDLAKQMAEYVMYNDYDPDERSWGYEEGILITPDQAQLLLNILIERATPKEHPLDNSGGEAAKVYKKRRIRHEHNGAKNG